MIIQTPEIKARARLKAIVDAETFETYSKAGFVLLDNIFIATVGKDCFIFDARFGRRYCVFLEWNGPIEGEAISTKMRPPVTDSVIQYILHHRKDKESILKIGNKKDHNFELLAVRLVKIAKEGNTKPLEQVLSIASPAALGNYEEAIQRRCQHENIQLHLQWRRSYGGRDCRASDGDVKERPRTWGEALNDRWERGGVERPLTGRGERPLPDGGRQVNPLDLARRCYLQ